MRITCGFCQAAAISLTHLFMNSFHSPQWTPVNSTHFRDWSFKPAGTKHSIFLIFNNNILQLSSDRDQKTAFLPCQDTFISLTFPIYTLCCPVNRLSADISCDVAKEPNGAWNTSSGRFSQRLHSPTSVQQREFSFFCQPALLSAFMENKRHPLSVSWLPCRQEIGMPEICL